MGKFCCKLGYHVYQGIGHLSACKFCGKKGRKPDPNKKHTPGKIPEREKGYND